LTSAPSFERSSIAVPMSPWTMSAWPVAARLTASADPNPRETVTSMPPSAKYPFSIAM
jgi:hypothetical protein